MPEQRFSCTLKKPVTAKALAPPFGMEIHQRSTSEEGPVSDCWQVRLTVGRVWAPGIAGSARNT